MPIKKENYPTNWASEIRPRILTRANFKCEHCGIRQHQYYIVNKWGNKIMIEKEDVNIPLVDNLKPKRVVLTIAHLDQDTHNNDEANLKALCQQCHLAHDRPFNLLKKIAKKKSPQPHEPTPPHKQPT